MARYDEQTDLFMSTVLGKEATADTPEEKKELIARQGIGIVKDIATAHSPAQLAQKLIKRTVSVATQLPSGIEKKSGLDLFEYMSNKYDDRWYHWSPETLWQTLEYDSIDITDELREAIQAFQVVSTTNYPFQDWHIFEKVGHAFNENPVNFGHVQPLELDEAAYTIKILTALRPGEEFEDDIKAYIAACAKEAGVVYLPTDLFPEGCQEFLDKMENDLVLKEAVARVYPKTLKEETALGIQLARLSEINTYVKG